MPRFTENFKGDKGKVNLSTYRYSPSETADCCTMYSYSKEAKNPVCYYGAKRRHFSEEDRIGTNKRDFCSIFVFYEGSFGFVFDDVAYHPSPGDIFVVKNNVEFTVFFPESTYAYYYEITFPMDFFEHVSDNSMFHRLFFDNADDGVKFILPNVPEQKALFEKFDNLDAVVRSDNADKDFLSFSYIIQIIGLISTFKNNKIEDVQGGKMPPKLKLALNYIHANFTDPITIGEISEHCGISNTYLARMFKKFYLCKPLEYVTRLRITYAKTLLAKGFSITEACYDSGFSDCKYFEAKFKAVVGMTPSKYKKIKS